MKKKKRSENEPSTFVLVTNLGKMRIKLPPIDPHPFYYALN
jgi:hypothetical protein